MTQTKMPPMNSGWFTWFFVSYLGKLQFPVTPALRIYGVVGITTATYQLNIGSLKQDASGTDFTFGGGIDYEVIDRWRVGGEWVRYWDKVDLGAGVKGSFDGLVGTVKYEF